MLRLAAASRFPCA
ncbi:hypothetical protein VCCP10303_3603, partial [Vibrio cholerae CP1030(3)]